MHMNNHMHNTYNIKNKLNHFNLIKLNKRLMNTYLTNQI